MNRAIKEEDLTQVVAIYTTQYGTLFTSEVDGYKETDPDYVRVTEPMKVTFTPLDDEIVLKGRIDAIDNQIEETRAELTRKISDLTDQKQRLLAITHEVQA